MDDRKEGEMNGGRRGRREGWMTGRKEREMDEREEGERNGGRRDRKSTRLNSSH